MLFLETNGSCISPTGGRIIFVNPKKKGSCRAIPVAQNCHENPSSSAEKKSRTWGIWKTPPKETNRRWSPQKGLHLPTNKFSRGYSLVSGVIFTWWILVVRLPEASLRVKKPNCSKWPTVATRPKTKRLAAEKKSHVQLAAHRHRKSVNVESWIHWFTSRWFNELAPIKTLFSCSILGITSYPVIYIGDYIKLLYGSLLTKKLDWNLPSLHFTNAPNVWNSY